MQSQIGKNSLCGWGAGERRTQCCTWQSGHQDHISLLTWAGKLVGEGKLVDHAELLGVFLGMIPRGDTLRLGNGGEEKGPRTLLNATS